MTPFNEPIYVTRPLLPPLQDLMSRLESVWADQWLTNAGKQHEHLEARLAAHLDVPHLSLFNNGTIALLTAIRAMDLRGSVVTTPFTFPATPHVLAWSGLEPIFCDIDPVTMTIGPSAVEAAIRPDTTAILGVHVYGLPCAVAELQQIADRRGLRLLYDGAHAFGTEVEGTAIGRFGDATMFSFHATKLFHTAEGGALATRDRALKARFDHLKNFGILNQHEVDVPGINGKMNELQAALGLSVLDHIPREMERRAAIAARYRERLSGIEGLQLLPDLPGVKRSNQYFVIRIDAGIYGCSRDTIYTELQKFNVFTRKYFFPLCSDYPCYRHLPSADPDRLKVARKVVDEVLCLPIYGGLPLEAIERISAMLLSLRASAIA